MRAREIIQEDYNENLESDLNNLLVAAKANGLQQVQTNDIVDQLYSMGYSINVNSLLPLLSENPMVMNATPEMINMTAPESVAQGPEALEAPDEGDEDTGDEMSPETDQEGLEQYG